MFSPFSLICGKIAIYTSFQCRKRCAKQFGEISETTPSRFLDELDEQHIVWEEKLAKDPQRKEEVGQAHLAAMRALLG